MLKAEEKAAKEFKEHSGTMTMCSNQQRWNQFAGSVEGLSVHRKVYVRLSELDFIFSSFPHPFSASILFGFLALLSGGHHPEDSR